MLSKEGATYIATSVADVVCTRLPPTGPEVAIGELWAARDAATLGSDSCHDRGEEEEFHHVLMEISRMGPQPSLIYVLIGVLATTHRRKLTSSD